MPSAIDQLMLRERQHRRPGGCRDRPADDDGHREADDADHRRLADLAGPNLVHVQAHEQRQRDRRGDREEAPRTAVERVDERHAHASERDDDDEEDRDGGDQSGERADLLCARSSASDAPFGAPIPTTRSCRGRRLRGRRPRRARAVRARSRTARRAPAR